MDAGNRINHPCKVQLRGFDAGSMEIAIKIASKFNSDTVDERKGVDIYFDDVNNARKFISKLRKSLKLKFRVKMSTRYAGLRKGRVRVFFVYSLRPNEEMEKG